MFCNMVDDPYVAKTARMLLTFPPGMWKRLGPEQQDALLRLWRRPLRNYTAEQWARLPSPVRDAYNRLRQLRSLPPLRPPPVDLSPKPYVPPPGPFDSSTLAAQINRTPDPREREVLYQQLLAETDSVMTARDGDRRLLAQRVRGGRTTPAENQLAAELLLDGKRQAAHRPATLGREIREDVAKSYLRAWYWLEPHLRISKKMAICRVKENWRISRTEAFELLAQIKAETIEHAETADGVVVVEPAITMRVSAGLLIRRGHRRLRRRRKASKAWSG
jgi:hypothetical protein